MSNNALFIYTHNSTFVRGDISILRKNYNLREYQFKNSPKSQLPLSLFKLFFYLLFNIYKYELIYIWFADYHSFIPTLFGKLFGKKVFLVIGGYDVCREKKYRYGSFSKPLRAYMALHSIKWASCNLCVSKNIERTVKAIAPNANTTTIYNGVLLPDQEIFSLVPESENTLVPESENTLAPESEGSIAVNSETTVAVNSETTVAVNSETTVAVNSKTSVAVDRKVLCVALVNTVQAFYIKGIDRYNRVASLLPNIQFVLIGCKPRIFTMAGETPAPNLKLIEAIPHEQLQGYYRSSHVYCQFSRRESFSLSLAEAMSYGMIPVISTAGGMPEVTGGLGFSIYFYEKSSKLNVATSSVKQGVATNSVKQGAVTSSVKQGVVTNSEQEAAQLVAKAIEMEKSPIYRERILENFTLSIRESYMPTVEEIK